MNSAMINIPRDELISTLMGIIELQQADQRSLLASLNELATGTGMNTTDISATDAIQSELTRGLVELMADNLILNDRVLSLVGPADFARLIQRIASALPADASEEERMMYDVQSDALGSMTEMVVTGLDDPEKDYDRAWRQINAYRDLCTERGAIDVEDQGLRDEFLRRSSTAEEWIEKTNKLSDVLGIRLHEAMRHTVKALISALVKVDPELADVDAGSLQVFQEEVDQEVQAAISPFVDKLTHMMQAYMDKRYIEIWGSSDI